MKSKGIALFIAGLVMAAFFAFREEMPSEGIADNSEVIGSPTAVVNQSDNEHSSIDLSAEPSPMQAQSSGPKDCKERLIYANDGSVYSALDCPSINRGETHPYEDELVYSNDALEVLALNNDAKAAEVLGKRLIGSDLETAYSMLVRASALSNDPSHLLWLSDQGFGATSVSGELNRKGTTRRYVLARVAEIMSIDSPTAEQFSYDRARIEGLLRENNVPEGVMIELERRSVELFGKIVTIQETSGSLSNEGGLNNV